MCLNMAESSVLISSVGLEISQNRQLEHIKDASYFLNTCKLIVLLEIELSVEQKKPAV